MGPFIEDGKYKVLEVLLELEGYKSCLCIDVETNNHYRPMIFNIYENEEDIRRYLPIFYNLDKDQFTDFIQVLSGKHCIIAIFEYHEGARLHEFFKDNKALEFEKRIDYATKLLQECLILDATTDLVSLPCLEPDHIVVADKSNRIMINYVIHPLQDAQSKGTLCAKLLEGMFNKNRFVPEILWEFIHSLRLNENASIVSIFSQWKELVPVLLKEHESLKKESLLAYLLRRLKQRLWRLGKRLR